MSSKDDYGDKKTPAFGTVVEVEGVTFRVATFGPAHVVTIRHVGPYTEVDATWDRLRQLAADHGFSDRTQKAIGIVHDNPLTTDEAQIRYDACIAVADEDVDDLESVIGGEDEARLEHLDSLTAWSSRHTGPYTAVREVYMTAVETREFADYEFAGPTAQPPFFEVYLNDPKRTAEEYLVTDVYMPAR